MLFPSLENAARLLSSLPGIGSRSALRIAFHLIRSDSDKSEDLAEALLRLKKEVRFCSLCGGLSDADLCPICRDETRDRSLLCIVEEPGDVYAIEKTGEFKGLYHVLMGAISPLDGIGPGDLRISELESRIASDDRIKEVLLATNPTLEGDVTADYIANALTGRNLNITRISHGVPTGAAIEYADRVTLGRSIRQRQDYRRGD